MSGKEALIRISDFDGTFTQETGDRYEQIWVLLLATKLEVPPDDLLPRIDDARLKVFAHPEQYGWEIDGRIVAPATTDRFLLMNCVTRIVVSNLRLEANHPRSLDTINTEHLLSDLFEVCYPLAESSFRDGAREFIEEQHRTGKFVIVTNSKTDHVKNQLEKLMGPDNGILVLGNAMKFKVSPNSPSITMPGLARPAYLDRPFYRQIIRSYLNESKQGVVMGDVAELDLILPLSMGVNGVLLTSGSTPEWEVNYVNNLPNGIAVNSLSEAATYIQTLT